MLSIQRRQLSCSPATVLVATVAWLFVAGVAATNASAQVGACCLGDASCAETNASGCALGDGDFLGEVTTCESAVCTGACCLADKQCTEGARDDCMAGTFRGPGTACDSHCASRLGAAFTYQGQLKQDGLPVNGLVDIEAALWTTRVGGEPVGELLLVSEVTVTNGLFSVDLDFGPNVFNGNSQWLEIAVRRPHDPQDTEPFTTLSPRQPLSATPYALALPGLYTQPNDTCPNVIGGFEGNEVTADVVGATIGGGGQASSGSSNRVTDDFGTVAGGKQNQAGDGAGTTADRQHATVGGGVSNTASGLYSTVGGGALDIASGDMSTIGGGFQNSASGGYSTVGGGNDNTASAIDSTVGGGRHNTADDSFSTVGGGSNNTASGVHSTVPGGASNLAGGIYSFAAGLQARANHHGSFVWGDATTGVFTATTGPNQFLIRASGGVGIGTNDPQAQLHVSGGTTILDQEPWNSADPENGWVNYGSGYAPVGYFKDSMGVVHLRGLVKSGTVGSLATFTLPAGYRPAYRAIFAVKTFASDVGRVDVLSDGSVVPMNGSPSYLSLEGISFRAEP